MKRLQNRIAESRTTLPLVSVYGMLVAVAIGSVGMQLGSAVWTSTDWWAQVGITALATMLMVELNNANSLIRVYSRMVSCSFLVLTLMATYLFPSLRGGMVGLSLVVFYVFYLRAYQNKTAVGPIYAAFLALGVGSMFFVQMLLLVPLFWLLMGARLMAFSGRTFWASIIGLITPYWFATPYYLYHQDYTTPLKHFLSLGQFMPLGEVFSTKSPLVAPIFSDPALLLTPHASVVAPLFTLGFVLLLTLIGLVHYLRQSSSDKLRTQMVYEIFIAITAILLLFLLLQPQHTPVVMRLLIVNTATLAGHFFALTHTKLTNIVFLTTAAITLFLTIYNLLFAAP